MMLGAALHVLLKRNHLVGVLEVLVYIVCARDLLLIQLDHFFFYTLEVIGDVEAVDESILVG